MGSPGRRPISRTRSEPLSEGPHRRKLYGRRKGPSLSAHQAKLLETLLPRLALTPVPGRDPRDYFRDEAHPGFSAGGVWLEIGFGAGEHLLWQAENHPQIGIIGVEPYVSGVAKLLSKLGSLAPTGGKGRGEGKIANIRLYGEDARDVIAALPDSSLDRVFLLFPDPWPKTRHHKRRFVQTEMLDQLARLMKPEAEFRFGTDDKSYLVWALERLVAHPAFAWAATGPADWRVRPPDWPQTRYEAKALKAGRVCTFLRFVRR
ncbi:MAG TPA: tRNA (guanine(46)-N(7))-methyltransferase TrmB [Micropepsaceae bacterium]|nr:tRNA (guanine(46)-N(7))-methyltransferase TrmB [Micropepsaceae bacterium]